MNLLVLNPLTVLMLITLACMVLLIGLQYKLFPLKTNTKPVNKYQPGGYITELQFSRCIDKENVPQENTCSGQLRDFSGGTFGI